jgi:hypothetical protein
MALRAAGYAIFERPQLDCNEEMGENGGINRGANLRGGYLRVSVVVTLLAAFKICMSHFAHSS